MAIKISGTTVIDDSRNLVSVGVATVGSGNSAVILNGITGSLNVGSGITMNGNTGDINISGILTVGQLSVPVSIISFSPAIGATGVSAGDTKIVLTFNQTVGLGTTGFIQLKVGSATTGTLNQTLYPVNTTLSNGGTVLNLNNSAFPNATNTIFPVMSSGFIVSNGTNFAGINTVGSATTYSFITKPLSPGDSFGGGTLICQSGGIRWVAANSNTQVDRSWYARADANTCAQAVTGCTGWFVPSCAQFENPGYVCRTNWCWQTAAHGIFWSDTSAAPSFPDNACVVAMSTPVPCSVRNPMTVVRSVRSFRCVSY